MEVRLSNMNAAKAVSDAVRTSLGPKGMDKMVRDTDVRPAGLASASRLALPSGYPC
jgi:chaperonin GroEL (HSP60 family)